MASYLPQAQDYIPQIQPFKPDFNFYQGALERKEGQYQQGYNRISGLYGTMLNSPLSRDDNNERREQFFKGVNDSIQKISGMDLSLQENVDSAYKVFQPLLDDNHIQKDMIFTKAYNTEMQRADGFRNCLDPKKCGGMYWNDGVRALQYQREDFRNADADSAMNMSNPRFTPAVNVSKDAFDLAKEMKFDVTRTSTDGKYIYTTTNGTAVEPGLNAYLMGAFKDNPAAQDMYNTKAYLQIKDSGRQYAAEHNISQDEAESQILSQFNDQITTQNQRNQNNIDTGLKLAQSKAAVLTKRVQEEQHPRFDLQKAVAQIHDLNDQIDKGTKAKQVYDNIDDTLDRSAMLGANKDVLMSRVKSALASHMMGMDLANAAHAYAMSTYEEKMVPNEYGVIATKHMNDIDDINLRAALDEHKLGVEWQYKMMLKNQFARGGILGNVATSAKGGFIGNQSKQGSYDVLGGFKEAEDQDQGILKTSSRSYVEQVYNRYKAILDDNTTDFTKDDKNIARTNLKAIMGNLVDDHGNLTTPLNKLDVTNLSPIYQKAVNDVHSSTMFQSDDWTYEMATKESAVDNANKMWNARNIGMVNNNKNILQYVNNRAGLEVSPEDRDGFNMYLDGKGNTVSLDQFGKAYSQHTGNNNSKSILKAYNDIHNQYVNLMNNPPTGLTIKAFDGSAQLGGQGGGRYSEPMQMVAMGDQPLSDATMGLHSLKANLDNLTPLDYNIVVGGANGFLDMNEVSKLSGTSDQARKVFNTMMEELNSSYKQTDKKQPKFTVKFSAVGAGDAHMQQVSIIPSYDWTRSHMGTKNMPGLTATMPNLATEGITVLLPESNANNAFSNTMKKSGNDIIINSGQPIAINGGKEGHVTIKRLEDGRLQVTGTKHGYNDPHSTKMGTDLISNTLDPGVSVDKVVNYYNEYFGKQREANISVERQFPKKQPNAR